MAEYYVSPTGSDAGAGSIGDPWETLAYSFTQLSAGDTLWCRGGTYSGSYMQWTPAGTSESPITVKAYPGETPILDGGYQAFREPGNGDWELLDAENDIWQSVATYSKDDKPALMGFFEDTEGTGERYRLFYYTDDSFTASHGSYGPYYHGPGTYWDADSGKIRICLRPPDADILVSSYDIPANTDPRANRIWLSGTRYGIYLRNGSNSITFDGLHVWLYERGIQCYQEVDNFVYKNASMLLGRDGIQCSAGAIDGFRVINSEFWGYRAPWLPWFVHKLHDPQETSAVRFRDPYPIANVLFANNMVDGVYDAIKWSSDFSGIIIANSITNNGDDAIQAGPENEYVEFCYNLTTHGTGIGLTGTGGDDNGEAWFIHHCIMRSEKTQWVFGDTELSDDLTPIGRHGTVTNYPSKIYNNTLINGGSLGPGTAHTAVNNTGHLHEVFNDIEMFDYETSTRPCVRQVSWDGKEVRDYNLYKGLAVPLLDRYRPAIGETETSYNTLALWQASAGFTASQAFYEPGLDANSIEDDPLLVDSVGGDFRPTSTSPAIGAATDLRAKDWPMNRLYVTDTIGALSADDIRPTVGRGYLPQRSGRGEQFVTINGARQYLIFDTEEEAQAAADAIADAMRQEVADADVEIRTALAQGSVALSEVGLSASGLTTSWAAPRLLSSGTYNGKYVIPLPSQESRTWRRDPETGATLYHTETAFEGATVAAI